MLKVFKIINFSSGLVALGVAGGIVAPITAPLAKAAIIKGLIIKKGNALKSTRLFMSKN